jgi:hypothetical protein
MAPAATAASTTATRQALLPCIHLQPLQSVHLHGWLNPKRTCHWDDMCHNPRITLDKCLELGICIDYLRKLQPGGRKRANPYISDTEGAFWLSEAAE